jgi:rare lipoprotein A
MGLIAMSPKSEARPPATIPLPPAVHHVPQTEVGWASWYGIERQGQHTASGELFDKDQLTAAHRKLPFGTTIRVTNLKNLASTMVRVNDRGPGSRRRVIDVSWAVAKELGFVEAGVARVAIDVISYPVDCIQKASSGSAQAVN